MRVRDAWFAPTGRVEPAAAEGLICARPVTPYPPGVPLLWPGEKITRAHIELIRERWYNEISEIHGCDFQRHSIEGEICYENGTCDHQLR